MFWYVGNQCCDVHNFEKLRVISPYDDMKTGFSKRAALESVFEKPDGGDRKSRLRVDASPK